MSNPTNDGIMAVLTQMNGLRGSDREAFITSIGIIAIEIMRVVYGDDYAEGWLQSAAATLKEPSQVGEALKRMMH